MVGESYFIYASANTQEASFNWSDRRNPPSKLEDELKTSKKMYCVSVGPNGEFFYSWKDCKGKSKRCTCCRMEGPLISRTHCVLGLTTLYHRLRTAHRFRLFTAEKISRR